MLNSSRDGQIQEKVNNRRRHSCLLMRCVRSSFPANWQLRSFLSLSFFCFSSFLRLSSIKQNAQSTKASALRAPCESAKKEFPPLFPPFSPLFSPSESTIIPQLSTTGPGVRRPIETFEMEHLKQFGTFETNLKHVQTTMTTPKHADTCCASHRP